MKDIDKELFNAIENDDIETLKKCIAAGADIEAKDSYGRTPLMFAASNGRSNCCKILIDADAFVTLKSDERKTVLDYAIECGHKNIIKLLKSLITPERELTEHILLNQDIENEVF